MLQRLLLLAMFGGVAFAVPNITTTTLPNGTVGVAYDTDLNQALTLIQEVLRENKRVLQEIAPVIGVRQLADSSINIAVKPWVNVTDFGPAGSEINKSLLEAFREHGIELPFPQREVRLVQDAA